MSFRVGVRSGQLYRTDIGLQQSSTLNQNQMLQLQHRISLLAAHLRTIPRTSPDERDRHRIGDMFLHRLIVSSPVHKITISILSQWHKLLHVMSQVY